MYLKDIRGITVMTPERERELAENNRDMYRQRKRKDLSRNVGR